MAAKESTLPYKLASLIICKVSLKLYLETYSKYKKTPPKVAKNATKTPINMSFFTVPKNLFFESYDEQSYQIEQELQKHTHFLMHIHLYLVLYLCL